MGVSLVCDLTAETILNDRLGFTSIDTIHVSFASSSKIIKFQDWDEGKVSSGT